MKKIFLLGFVLLLILLSVNLYADIISADFGLEIGWLPQGTLIMYESRDVYNLSNTFYVVMSNRTTLFDLLFIGGSVDISMHYTDFSFNTQGIDYMFETGLQFGILEIFYKHNRIHPAPTYLYNYFFEGKWETAHDRIGIKISGKVN